MRKKALSVIELSKPFEFYGIRLADTNCTAFSTMKETAVIPAQAGITERFCIAEGGF